MEDNAMQQLHAYWRMEYLEIPKEDGLRKDVFTEIPKVSDDKEVHILCRGDHTYLVLNRFPYNAGHLMVVPYRKVGELKDLNTEERGELMDMLIKGQEILEKALKPQGFNIGINLGDAAGAGIPDHLHFHIVPRWRGDTNFMPVLGNTKVLSESLEMMWERLRAFC